MKLTKLFLRSVSIWAVVLSFIVGDTNEARACPVDSVGTASRVELPFKLHDGYLIVVEGRIGARQHLRFALDTGSTYSVLRSDLAEGINPSKHATRVLNLDHVVSRELWDVPDLQLGPLRFSSLPMMLHSLDYLRSTGPSVDALIGLDVLQRCSFAIDFERHVIVFGTSRRLRSEARLDSSEPYWAVEAVLMNRSVRLIVDTGVPSILLYRDRLGNRLPKLPVERVIRGVSVGGTASLEVVTLPSLQLNGKELNRRAVMLENSPQKALPRVDGYLSLVALGARRLYVDVENNVMSWE